MARPRNSPAGLRTEGGGVDAGTHLHPALASCRGPSCPGQREIFGEGNINCLRGNLPAAALCRVMRLRGWWAGEGGAQPSPCSEHPLWGAAVNRAPSSPLVPLLLLPALVPVPLSQVGRTARVSQPELLQRSHCGGTRREPGAAPTPREPRPGRALLGGFWLPGGSGAAAPGVCGGGQGSCCRDLGGRITIA